MPAPAPEVAAPPILPDTREAPSRTAGSLQQAIDDHDLHAVAWSLLSEAVVEETKNASLISTLVRVLASLGPAPADDESVLRQIVLHGKAMWGIAPGTDNEWELAGQLFDDEALDMFRHWEATEKRLT